MPVVDTRFDPFVLPFTLGIIFLMIVILIKFRKLIKGLSPEDRLLAKKSLFSWKSVSALYEVFMESLIHRKLWKKSPFLGYMHMSFAFGWFLLIALGNLESRLHHPNNLNPPYFPIFYKFFNHNVDNVPLIDFFHFTMDFLLAAVMLGLMLAIMKRFWHRFYKMKRTTKMIRIDRVVMTSLWCIFPFRLLAESFTAGVYNNGGFLVGNLGHFFAGFLPLEPLSYIAWWAYSIALGVFFVSIPWSRYMHIPTEVLLIFLRQYGIKDRKERTSFADIEILSCPRCGVCIDVCQLRTSIDNKTTQAVYYLRAIRERNILNRGIPEVNTFDCLMCGRCMEVCPVGIDINAIRMYIRQENYNVNGQNQKYQLKEETTKADVLYFAGCMTHLTPSIKKSVLSIFDHAKINYHFIDKEEGICCGRPMMLSGKRKEAEALIALNSKIIIDSSAKTLVTSCPICLKVFKEEYDLDIEILHHTQYFLRLAEENKIPLQKNEIKTVFHDPCELGRGSGIYREPRILLEKTSNLQTTAYEKENSLCCGGSLGSFVLNSTERSKVTKDVISALTKGNPDMIVTACPLCKKTLAGNSDIQVKDISEIIAESIREKVREKVEVVV